MALAWGRSVFANMASGLVVMDKITMFVALFGPKI